GRRQAGGGEVEHVAHGRQELPGELWQWRLADSRHGLGPDLLLKCCALRVRGLHFYRIRDGAVEREPSVDVLPEAFLKDLSWLGGQEIQPKVGAADGIGLIDHKLAARVEAGRGPGEGEREQ